MYAIQEKAHQFHANILGAPMIQLKNKEVRPDKGSINLRDPLLDPINLKDYYFVYTSRGDRDD